MWSWQKHPPQAPLRREATCPGPSPSAGSPGRAESLDSWGWGLGREGVRRVTDSTVAKRSVGVWTPLPRAALGEIGGPSSAAGMARQPSG